jgi:GntR family transcriptional regulator, phosphonate transport system regulatory protein
MTAPTLRRGMSLWQSIAQTLRAEIVAGHFGHGDKLPTEADLARRFGVNRHTVRRAVGQMAADGLVHARRGAGVFVAPRPTDYPLGQRVRFQRNIEAAGRVAGREILSMTTRLASMAEAAALHLGPGEMVHDCEGVSLADRDPIALFRSLFPATLLPNLPVYLLAEQSVTKALALHGLPDYLRLSTRISAQLANPIQASLLRIRHGDPLLQTVAINTNLAGDIIEQGITWFAGEKVTLTLTQQENTL